MCFVLLLLGLAFSGCKPKAEAVDVRVSVQLLDGGQPIEMGDIFLTEEGYRVRFDNLKFYLGSFTLGSPEAASDMLNPVVLINMTEDETEFTGCFLASEIDAVHLTVGVDAAINDNPEPSAYPTDHDLSDFALMFWTWNSGYKFIELEGRMDLTGTDGATLDDFVSIHTGLTENIRQRSFSLSKTPDGGAISLEIGIEVSTLFNAVESIDLAEGAQTHTTDVPALALAFTENFIASISVE